MDSSPQPVNYNIGPRSGKHKTLIRIGEVIALALVAGFVAWIVIDHLGNDSATTTTPATTTPAATTPSTTGPTVVASSVGPVAVGADELSPLVANVGHPVYWAGPIAGKAYEFTQTTAGNVYIRYLPQGVAAGNKRVAFLIIVTYPLPNAYDALKNVAKGSEVEIPGGGIAVVSPGYPQSVHFAFPGVSYQGEVFDPSPAKALAVATSGDIQQVP
jgi:hypothetical protein